MAGEGEEKMKVFFFFKQKTAYEVEECDWSSDVCSSDLKIPVEKTGEKCPDCKKGDVIIRIGRFGKFLSCSLFPECKYTKNYNEKVGIDCPKCGGEIIVRRTRRGKQFYGCLNYPDCDYAAWKKQDIGKEPAETKRKPEKGKSAKSKKTKS